jgi:hypothetical protein
LNPALNIPPERRLLKHVAAAAWFCALAVICSYPLALAPGSWIPGSGPGDNTMFLWNFWWMRQALEQPGLAAFHTTYLFAPYGTPLVLNTHTALQALIGATLLGSLPLTTAHNVVLLAGLAGNGLASYALAFREVRRVMPAVLAGTLFASSTYVAIHLLGHFNMVHAWVIPIAALAWIRSDEHPSAGRCFATAVAFAAASYSDYYYLVYCVMFAIGWSILRRGRLEMAGRRFPRGERLLAALACLVIVVIIAIAATDGFTIEAGGMRISASNLRNPIAALWILFLGWMALRCRVTSVSDPVELTSPRPWRWAAAGVGLYLILVLPLIVGAIRLFTSDEYVSPPQHWRTGARGIDLATVVLGNPLHPWYGSWTRDIYGRVGIDVMEQVAWIGIIPIVLLVSGFRRALTSDTSQRWMWLTALFFVWSLGSFLSIGGIDTGVPLPQLLGRVTPILSNARMPGRAIVMVQLGVAMLCAAHAAQRGWRSPLIAAVISLTMLDTTATPFPMLKTDLNGDADELIMSSPRGIVVELPFGIRDGLGTMGHFDHRALIHQTVHGQPIAGGAVARLPAWVKRAYAEHPAFASLMSWPIEELPENLAADLRATGVRYLLVNRDALVGDVGVLLRQRGLRLLITDGARELYAVD